MVTLGDFVSWHWNSGDGRRRTGVITATSRQWWVAKGCVEIDNTSIVGRENVQLIKPAFPYPKRHLINQHRRKG
jgi:hypothetical protein